MLPNMRVLTINHFGDTVEENLEVTLCAMSIKMVAAKDIEVQGRPVKQTTVLFMDSEPIELNLSSLDLMQLQSVVGAYSFFEES